METIKWKVTYNDQFKNPGKFWVYAHKIDAAARIALATIPVDYEVISVEFWEKTDPPEIIQDPFERKNYHLLRRLTIDGWEYQLATTTDSVFPRLDYPVSEIWGYCWGSFTTLRIALMVAGDFADPINGGGIILDGVPHLDPPHDDQPPGDWELFHAKQDAERCGDPEDWEDIPEDDPTYQQARENSHHYSDWDGFPS